MGKTTSPRQSSIELLRILSVIGVVMLHYNNANRGRGFSFVVPGSLNQYYLYLLECICICAVNVFIFISSYYLSTTDKRRFIKIVELLLQLIVFRVLFYVADVLFITKVFSKKGLLEAFLPLDYYVVLYLVLYLISPFINIMLSKLNRTSFRRLLLISFILFSCWNIIAEVLDCLYGRTLYGLSTIGMDGSQHGYTIVNFVLLYLIAAYIKRYNIRISSGKAIVGIVLSVTVIFITANIERILGFRYINSWAYENPFVIAFALFVFMLALNIQFYSKVINELARGVFTCYLFHGFFLQFLHIPEFVGKSLPLLIAHTILCGAGLFLVSYIIYKVYYLASNWLIKRLTPLCNKVKISLDN